MAGNQWLKILKINALIDYSSLYNPLPPDTGSALALVIMFLPFLSFLVLWGFNRRKSETLAWLGTGIHMAAAVVAGFVFSMTLAGQTFHTRTMWFKIATAEVDYPFTVGVWIDGEAALMLLVVTVIAFLVHLYSIEYMKGDKHYIRYFAFLGLFTFAMIGVVLMDNLLLLFVFWELVGVASYSLIGFWNERKAATDASNKAFIMNRIGDAGFLVALMILWSQFGTLDLQVLESLMQQSVLTEGGTWLGYFRVNGLVFENAAPAYWLTLAGIGLFCGTIGKSAQFPLQTWLPDAMQGPTPASALIHAATMVAAGVYLLAQVFVLLNGEALTIIAFTGAVTAFMAAVAALTQHDIKRVLAYSTISQLGYMVMAMGVGAYDAALFHLITHASFKACLFLAAGSVIHGMHEVEKDLKEESQKKEFDPQDMRWMGGLRKKMPVTFIAYLIAALALGGLPLFSGFLSKDAILAGSLAWADAASAHTITYHGIVVILAFMTSLLTALYMGRQILLVFFGDFRAGKVFRQAEKAYKHMHEASWEMKIPLIILSVLSLGVVYSWNPLDGSVSWVTQRFYIPLLAAPGGFDYYDHLESLKHNWHAIASYGAMTMSVLGITLAYVLFRPDGKRAGLYHTSGHYRNLLARISYHHWYLDALYRHTVISPVKKLALVTAWVDRKVVDGAVNMIGMMSVIFAHIVAFFDRYLVDGLVNLLAFMAGGIGHLARSIQGGRIQTYFILTLLGVVVMLIWMII